MRKIVLMYHCIYKKNGGESGFQNTSAYQYKVSVEKFEQEVRIVRDYLIKNNLPEESVEFTFDDGGVSFFTLAMPILEKYGFKGVFFIATKFIDTPLFLSSKQIQEMDARGHVIASHSHSHCENMKLLTLEQMTNEWRHSCSILSDIISKPVHIASIPNGYGSGLVYLSAKKSGINCLYTSIPSTRQVKKNNISLVGRYVIHDNTTLEDFQRLLVSDVYRWKLKMKYNLLQIVHLLLGNQYNKVKTALLRGRA